MHSASPTAFHPTRRLPICLALPVPCVDETLKKAQREAEAGGAAAGEGAAAAGSPPDAYGGAWSLPISSSAVALPWQAVPVVIKQLRQQHQQAQQKKQPNQQTALQQQQQDGSASGASGTNSSGSSSSSGPLLERVKAVWKQQGARDTQESLLAAAAQLGLLPRRWRQPGWGALPPPRGQEGAMAGAAAGEGQVEAARPEEAAGAGTLHLTRLLQQRRATVVAAEAGEQDVFEGQLDSCSEAVELRGCCAWPEPPCLQGWGGGGEAGEPPGGLQERAGGAAAATLAAAQQRERQRKRELERLRQQDQVHREERRARAWEAERDAAMGLAPAPPSGDDAASYVGCVDALMGEWRVCGLGLRMCVWCGCCRCWTAWWRWVACAEVGSQ